VLGWVFAKPLKGTWCYLDVDISVVLLLIKTSKFLTLGILFVFWLVHFIGNLCWPAWHFQGAFPRSSWPSITFFNVSIFTPS
jgi:hypothetical protein